jgi:sulfopropanediol 3-dehydrogenase
MRFSPRVLAAHDGAFRHVKQPAVEAPADHRDPRVIERVSEMLSTIERGGMDAVLRYAAELDGWDGSDPQLSAADLASCGDRLEPGHREALALGADRTRRFAEAQRRCLQDIEVELEPGLVVGHRYLPVRHVGAYMPAGRFPLTAGAFMTVNVAKCAGVPEVVAATPPGPDGRPDPAVVHAAHLSGADRVVVLGGVQALAAMAFGLIGPGPVDMLVGAGNAYVTEAKRQLFGAVALDLLAGPSEVAVLADETADAELVAADLLGQAEHGVNSPAALITTSADLADAVVVEVDRQLAGLATREIAGPAWRDFGSVTWARDAQTAVALSDDLAPEHLEVITADDDWYHKALTSYGSLFLGPWSTVAYSDKGMAGTNHVLPTGTGARHSAGLSVSRFLRPLTYQRVAEEATPALAPAVETISAYEGMAAHGATASLRRRRHEGRAR